MTRHYLLPLTLLSLFLLSTPPNALASDKIEVAATLVPLGGFAERVGGDRLSVTVLIPAGASPHTFEPLPSQLRKFSEAKALVKVGTGVEFEINWLGKLLSLNKKLKVIDCSQGIEPIKWSAGGHPPVAGGQDRGYDPHIWLSPKNAMIMVENIRRVLSHIDPLHESYYQANARAFTDELRELDGEIRDRLSQGGVRSFISLHPSWGYFAKEYGLEQIAIERRERELSSKHMMRVIATARERGIRVIIASTEFEMASARTVAREIGGEVALVSPLARDYVANLRKLSRVLAKGGEEVSER